MCVCRCRACVQCTCSTKPQDNIVSHVSRTHRQTWYICSREYNCVWVRALKTSLVWLVWLCTVPYTSTTSDTIPIPSSSHTLRSSNLLVLALRRCYRTRDRAIVLQTQFTIRYRYRHIPFHAELVSIQFHFNRITAKVNGKSDIKFRILNRLIRTTTEYSFVVSTMKQLLLTVRRAKSIAIFLCSNRNVSYAA